MSRRRMCAPAAVQHTKEGLVIYSHIVKVSLTPLAACCSHSVCSLVVSKLQLKAWGEFPWSDGKVKRCQPVLPRSTNIVKSTQQHHSIEAQVLRLVFFDVLAQPPILSKVILLPFKVPVWARHWEQILNRSVGSADFFSPAQAASGRWRD